MRIVNIQKDSGYLCSEEGVVLFCPYTKGYCGSLCAWFIINDGGLQGFSDKTIRKEVMCRDKVIGIIVK